MRVIFMGTPEFAVPTLQKLANSGKHIVIEVFSQPDRPKGRGKKLAFPPVKEAALDLGLSCYQPESVRKSEVIEHIRELQPDVVVVVAYGKILPKELLEIPRYGCINVHSSLLPKYRGAAPIHWAIYNGEEESGVTTMLLDEGMDTGDILLAKTCNISDSTTMGELHDQLKEDGALLLLDTLEGIGNGTLKPVKQDETWATHAPLITKNDEVIDWKRNAEEVRNQVRAFNPWPGSYTHFRGERLKIWKANVGVNLEPLLKIGEVRVHGKNVYVGTGKGNLALLEVQPQSRAKVSAIDWARGQNLELGEYFIAEPDEE